MRVIAFPLVPIVSSAGATWRPSAGNQWKQTRLWCEKPKALKGRNKEKQINQMNSYCGCPHWQICIDSSSTHQYCGHPTQHDESCSLWGRYRQWSTAYRLNSSPSENSSIEMTVLWLTCCVSHARASNKSIGQRPELFQKSHARIEQYWDRQWDQFWNKKKRTRMQ